jgi:16S rRNA (cytosine1402-N4)-methyltransferase
MGGLWTTLDLRTAVEDCVPQHVLPRTLSRVFQAFRIVVNDELGVLERTLRGVTRRLKPGGRIVVLSYHSLEDRIVKDVFRDLAKTSVPDPGNLRSSTKPVDPLLTVVTKKPQEPSAEEIQRNVRARSARLRIAFRTETPYRDTELLFPGETDLQRLSDVRP